MIRRLLLSLAALAASHTAAAEPVAIYGDTVWTGTSQGTITNGVVVINNGRIVSVGPAGAGVPAGATEVRAKWVTPGLISAFSRTGLAEVSGVDDANDTGAPKSEFSAALNAADGFNPDDTAIAVSRVGGFTRLAVAPSARTKLFGGQGFLADTTGEEDSAFRPRAFAYIVLGETGGGRRCRAGRGLRPGPPCAARSMTCACSARVT
jgi:imidazolonepropionase-like amidohydrolase